MFFDLKVRYFSKEENNYDVLVDEEGTIVSCQCQYFVYRRTACKHMFLVQRFMPVLIINQTSIDTDFNTVGIQLIELNQVEDNNNSNNNTNSDNNNEDSHADTNNIGSEISSNILELQTIFSAVPCENCGSATLVDINKPLSN